MRNLLLAALVSTALLAAPARAVDTAMFNAVASQIPVPQPDKYDERAILAALLARPDVAAEFEADGKAALSDPQLKPLMIAKWRGRAAAYATTQANRPGADVSKTYHNWKEVLGPEGYAYTRQRLLSMTKDNADKLIGYLGTLDKKLQENNFKIDDSFFGMSGKIVNGILDAYRKDLGQYLATAEAQSARNAVAASAQQLAAGITAKNAVASVPATQPATQPATKPTTPVRKPPTRPTKPVPAPAKPPVKTPPVAPNGGSVVVTNPSGGALNQARGAAQAGQNNGQVFDGGGASGSPTGGSAVVVPPTSGAAAGTPLASPAPGPKAPVVGDVPSPTDDLDARVAQASASGRPPYAGKADLYAAGGGGLLGGLIGFFLGGPIGALVGAAIGGLAGHFLAKKLFQ
ncbi:MAG: hypothetical protein KGL74_04965 [Elusimicrobia bacterium]|nr:hypothetical protein [Elusimicrobiota bacterium]